MLLLLHSLSVKWTTQWAILFIRFFLFKLNARMTVLSQFSPHHQSSIIIKMSHVGEISWRDTKKKKTSSRFYVFVSVLKLGTSTNCSFWHITFIFNNWDCCTLQRKQQKSICLIVPVTPYFSNLRMYIIQQHYFCNKSKSSNCFNVTILSIVFLRVRPTQPSHTSGVILALAAHIVMSAYIFIWLLEIQMTMLGHCHLNFKKPQVSVDN